MEFPWRCNVDTIAMDLKVSWEMSAETTVTEVDPRDWSCRQLPFVAMATLWVLAVFAVSRGCAMEQLAFVGIGMLLLGVPMCLAGICSGTLRQQRRAAAFFLRQGWLYDLWGRCPYLC